MAHLLESIRIPARMLFCMWALFWLQALLSVPLNDYGILPRTFIGLIGILTAPLLHGNLAHLVSNSVPLLFLGTTLYFFYRKQAFVVFTSCYLVTGVLVWIFARSSIHIGASGLIYGLASFLVFAGLFRRDFMAILISVVIILSYSQLIYGLLPIQKGVSFESHLLGGLVGLFCAWQLRNSKEASR